MRDFKKGRGRQQQYMRMSIGLGAALLLLVVAFFTAHGAWDMYGKFTQAAAARADEEAQLSELQSRYQSIKTDVSTLQSERGVEAQVRERYGVVRPGEGEIDIVRSASSTESTAQAPGWWQRLWRLISIW